MLLALVYGGFALRGSDVGADQTKVFSLSRNGNDGPAMAEIVAARPMPVCGNRKRINCVVDGDTFWLDGGKYRISNIDTPEINGQCEAERQVAFQARDRLAALLDNRPIRISSDGTDVYGRTLAKVSDPSGDIGDRLATEGLAEIWGGKFINWCES